MVLSQVTGNHVENYWINTITPEMLSVFGQTRRTNSEVEGFHCAFAKRIRRNTSKFWFFKETEISRSFV